MQHLRANTQVIVTVGPFVDVDDGFTPQVDITLAGDEAELIKHGSTTVVDISGATWAAVANCRGYYSLTLTASHTDTEGMLVVVVQDDSDSLPVKAEYMVLSEVEYDRLYASADAVSPPIADFYLIPDKDLDGWIAIRLGVTGKVVGDLTIKHLKEGITGAGTAYSPAAGDWKEGDSGDYWLNIGASEFTDYGLYRVTIVCTGCPTYTCYVQVGLDMANVNVGNVFNLYVQLRRLHAFNANKVTYDHPIDQYKHLYRNENDSANLLQKDVTSPGTNITVISPSKVT